MTHEDPRVRRRAARKLGEYVDPLALDPLLRAMHDTDVFVRKHAIVGLGTLGDREAVGPLLESSRDKRGGVRRESVRALAQICRSHPDLIPAILPTILTAARRDNANQRIQYSVALCSIGPKVIVPLCLEYNSFRNQIYQECIEFALVLLEQRERVDVARCLLSDPTLTAPQQWIVLELLTRRRPRILFTPRRLLDTRLFCETIANDPDEHDDTRRGARGILDYLSLGRASQRSDTDARESQQLLRMATGTSNNAEQNHQLLRASVKSEEDGEDEDQEVDKRLSPLARLMARLRDLFN